MGNKAYSLGFLSLSFFFFLDDILDMRGGSKHIYSHFWNFPPTVECKSWENRNLEYLLMALYPSLEESQRQADAQKVGMNVCMHF